MLSSIFGCNVFEKIHTPLDKYGQYVYSSLMAGRRREGWEKLANGVSINLAIFDFGSSTLRQRYSNPGNGSQKLIRVAAAKGGHYPYI
jgi:hypothetical protein